MATTIVIPLPGPQPNEDQVAECAIPFARSLAERSGAAVHLVTVLDVPAELSAYFAFVNLSEEIDESWTKDRQDYLGAVAGRFGDHPVTTEVRYGDPADEVAKVVEQFDDPLLVMASHARAGLSRTLLGSVAFRIVHRVHCPIFIIRAGNGCEKDAPAELTSVLIPLDGSEFARQALERALTALGRPGLDVRLLHVIEPPPNYYGFVLAEYFEDATDWAAGHLTEVANDLNARGYHATWEVRRGRVAHEVIEAANERSVSLIAMATHGRTGISRLMFGSNAERVLHEATTPLLLIPSAGAQPEARSKASEGTLPLKNE